MTLILKSYFSNSALCTSYITTHFYAVRRIRALKMSTKMLREAEICLEYGCKNLKHNITIKKMKKNTTTLLVGIGLVLTASLLLFFREKEEDNNKNIEEKKEKDKVNEKKPEPSKIKVIDEKKNQQIINKAVRDLIENNEYGSLADLLGDLVSEIVKRSGDIDILYDAPKTIEELEEVIISLGLYDKVSDKLREKNR